MKLIAAVMIGVVCYGASADRRLQKWGRKAKLALKRSRTQPLSITSSRRRPTKINSRATSKGKWKKLGSSSGSDNWGSPSTEWEAKPLIGKWDEPTYGELLLDGSSSTGWKPSTRSSGWKPSTGSSGWEPSIPALSEKKPAIGLNAPSTTTKSKFKKKKKGKGKSTREELDDLELDDLDLEDVFGDDSSETDDTKPTTTPTNPRSTNSTSMKMAGTDELLAFNEQNRIRTNPRAVQKVVKEQIKWFGSSRTMLRHSGYIWESNAGIGEWYEADRELGRQKTFEPLKWNDYLALACEDHCKDTGASGRTGHSGSDGSKPWDRMNRYGKYGGSVGENIAYGDSDGAAYMVQLYIDDGVANRSHRDIMLKPAFKETGIAVCKHKGYKK
jgi:hypothetical protein